MTQLTDRAEKAEKERDEVRQLIKRLKDEMGKVKQEAVEAKDHSKYRTIVNLLLLFNP